MKYSKLQYGVTHVSVFLNNITGGPPGYSLCARFYENWLTDYHRSVGPWYYTVKIVDTVMYPIESKHCFRSWAKRNTK